MSLTLHRLPLSIGIGRWLLLLLLLLLFIHRAIYGWHVTRADIVCSVLHCFWFYLRQEVLSTGKTDAIDGRFGRWTIDLILIQINLVCIVICILVFLITKCFFDTHTQQVYIYIYRFGHNKMLSVQQESTRTADAWSLVMVCSTDRTVSDSGHPRRRAVCVRVPSVRLRSTQRSCSVQS